MKLRNKNLIKLFIIHLLTYSVISSPQCLIKLACKGICEQFNLINGINLNSDNIALNEVTSETVSINKYESIQFGCEPGDKISFINNNNDGGVAFYLKITGDNNEDTIYRTGVNDNILVSSSSCIPGSETVQIEGIDLILCQYSEGDSASASFTINIPYEFEDPNIIFENVLYSEGKVFKFDDIFNPKINGAEKLDRITIKISTQLLDSNKEELKKGTEDIGTDTIILLNDNISFKPKNNYYGKFTIIFKIFILSVENSQDFSIDFNVCYIYCDTCDQYNDVILSSSNIFNCLSCNSGYYFVDNENGGNINNRCYSSSEINSYFPNYFFNSLKYEKCDNSCNTCVDSSN